MSAWAVTMGAGVTMGSCMSYLPFHAGGGRGPKSITWTPAMAKHNSRVTGAITANLVAHATATVALCVLLEPDRRADFWVEWGNDTGADMGSAGGGVGPGADG